LVVPGIANTVCVVHAANQDKSLPEYTQEDDILFPVGTILVKGIAKVSYQTPTFPVLPLYSTIFHHFSS
jgi:hypothetical protein